MIATVSAFITGIQISCLSSVGMEDMEYAESLANTNYYVETLLYITAFGAVFSCFSVVISAFLYISLSSLSGVLHNNDKLLHLWFVENGVFYVFNLLFLYFSIFLMISSVYYLGVVKFPDMAKNVVKRDIYRVIGLSFTVLIILFSLVASYRHRRILNTVVRLEKSKSTKSLEVIKPGNHFDLNNNR